MMASTWTKATFGRQAFTQAKATRTLRTKLPDHGRLSGGPAEERPSRTQQASKRVIHQQRERLSHIDVATSTT